MDQEEPISHSTGVYRPAPKSRWLASTDGFKVASLVPLLVLAGFGLYKKISITQESEICVNQAKALSQALLLYSADHNGLLPPIAFVNTGESCLIDQRRTKDSGNIYTFNQKVNWLTVSLPYIKTKPSLTCPGDPTPAYEETPAISYTPLTGPAALTNPDNCEPANGVMGKNWGANVQSIKDPAGTALVYESIDPMGKDMLLKAGTIDTHTAGIFDSLSWCGVLAGQPVYPRKDAIFSYDANRNYEGPHRSRLTVARVDGHASNLALARTITTSADQQSSSLDCRATAKTSLFDKRYPLEQRP